MGNSSYVDLLIDSLKKKLDVLKEIITVNAQLKELVFADKFELDAFDAISESKEKLLNEIERLDEGFETTYNRVKDELNGNKALYAEQIRTMQNLIQEIVDTVAAIEVEEKRIQNAVVNQFSKLKQAVKESRKSSRAVSNYYKSMGKVDYSPQFMDSKK